MPFAGRIVGGWLFEGYTALTATCSCVGLNATCPTILACWRSPLALSRLDPTGWMVQVECECVCSVFTAGRSMALRVESETLNSPRLHIESAFALLALPFQPLFFDVDLTLAFVKHLLFRPCDSNTTYARVGHLPALTSPRRHGEHRQHGPAEPEGPARGAGVQHIAPPVLRRRTSSATHLQIS